MPSTVLMSTQNQEIYGYMHAVPDRITKGTKFLSKTKRNKEVFQPSPLVELLLLVLWLEFVPGYLTGLELVCQEYSSSLPSHSRGHAGS